MWRRKWVIILVTVVATAAAFGFSYRQAKVYEAQADLIYEQQLDVSNPLTGQTYTDPNARSLELDSVDAIIKSAPIAHARRRAARGAGHADHRLQVRSELAQQADATTTAGEQRGLDLRHQRGSGAGGGGLAGLRRRLRGVAQGPRAQADRRVPSRRSRRR